MARHFEFDQNARSALKAGVDKLADVVAVTLGPRGRLVLVRRRAGPPAATSDGVTVAREVVLPDARENLGATLLKEVATNTQAEVGDGTTTAVVLARAMVDAGLLAVVSGAHPMAVKRGMDRACASVVSSLRTLSRTADAGDIRGLGTQSVGSDSEVGRLLAEAIHRVGPTGIVQVETTRGVGTELTVESGMHLDEGYLSPYFVTDPERLECVFDKPLLFVTARAVESVHELVPALELAAATHRSLVIVADSLTDEALSMLVTNRVRGNVRVCAVAAPGYGERRRAALEDIAALGGGRCVNDDAGADPTKLKGGDLGSLRRAVIGRERSLFTAEDNRSEALVRYVDDLRRARAAAQRAPELSRLNERISRLEAPHAVLRVGAHDEVSLLERKSRVEDAVAATRAAFEEGIVVGGGVAFLRALLDLDGSSLSDDEALGRQVLTAALRAPAFQIASNAGHDGTAVVARILKTGAVHGFDAEREELADLADRGVVDPVKVTRVALEQAVSISGAILTTDALITDSPDAEDKKDD